MEPSLTRAACGMACRKGQREVCHARQEEKNKPRTLRPGNFLCLLLLEGGGGGGGALLKGLLSNPVFLGRQVKEKLGHRIREQITQIAQLTGERE